MQRKVVERDPALGPLLVVGAPGSGKTHVALEAFLRRASAEPAGAVPRHVLLAPTRTGAGELRELATVRLLEAGAARRSPAVHTPVALAFRIVQRYLRAEGRSEPSLITGGSQDSIIAELIAGRLAGFGRPLQLPDSIALESLGFAAFRAELRNVFSRAAEFGLEPSELRALGRPEWVFAADLLEEYLDVVALEDLPAGRGERYDAARIVGVAASLIEQGLIDPGYKSVIVDDYQEASAAVVRFLAALAARGAQLTLLADPDVAVQTFRGARPQFVGRAAHQPGELGAFAAQVVVLPFGYRGTPQLRAAVQEVTGRIPASGVVEHRKASLAPAIAAAGSADLARGATALKAFEVSSPGAEIGRIAHELRRAHLHAGLAWNQMAVICRSGGAVHQLQRALRAFDIPIAKGAGTQALRDLPAVRMLLTSLEAGVGELTAERMAEMLTSEIGGLDGLGMRRLRRIVATHIANEKLPALATAEGIVALSAGQTLVAELPEDLRVGLLRVLAVVGAAGEASSAPPRQALWQAWEATGLAEVWRERALAGGPLGERADEDLDAVLALFELAENYELRVSGAGIKEFVASVRAEALPADNLAEAGIREPAVAALTVAQAAGREWELVVIAGLQDGEWPNTRIRDSVLGAAELADLQLGRLGLDARSEVIGDEWRLLAAAISRAKSKVIATAVAAEDSRPSAFFTLLAELAGGDSEPELTARRLDLRGMVAELRVAAEDAGSDTAAKLLALLAGIGLPGAAPSSWAGVEEPSSSIGMFDGTVYVSPSKVESATRCGLRWALEANGGSKPSKIEQNLGNLIHEIAAEMPHGSEAELLAALEARFDTLGLPDSWVRDRQFEAAKVMLGKLAAYFASVPGEVAVEVPIKAQAGDATIVGRIDRVEWVDGGARIVDLKSGKEITQAEGQENPQLAVYQLAVNKGALGAEVSSAGARLVYLGGTTKSASLRSQDQIEGSEGNWARTLLDSAVEVMRGSEFAATVSDKLCQHCPVRRSCPAQDIGKRSAE